MLSGAVNNIDSSLSFRFMKSERVVGCALKYLIEEKGFQRNEFFISSKGGFLDEDADKDVHLPQTIQNILEHEWRTAPFLSKKRRILRREIRSVG